MIISMTNYLNGFPTILPSSISAPVLAAAVKIEDTDWAGAGTIVKDDVGVHYRCIASATLATKRSSLPFTKTNFQVITDGSTLYGTEIYTPPSNRVMYVTPSDTAPTLAGFQSNTVGTPLACSSIRNDIGVLSIAFVSGSTYSVTFGPAS